jgi:hypothetical protein
VIDMCSRLISEHDSGVIRTRIHPHNGYYAGDFSDVPVATPRQLAAVTALDRPRPLPRLAA